MKQIPVIDLFAGPGGLAEGFSSVLSDNERVFKIKLSIEKDENAHKTLLLRSFCRQFPKNALPKEYYHMAEAKSVEDRERRIKQLFDLYPKEALAAKEEAWLCELGAEKFPENEVDDRIQTQFNGSKDWVLIGGPPCQAYSMAGRSRVGGINPEDHRVFLYKEYLRIIARHQPAVFVMENVKGLLSAEVNGEKVFDWIKRDLQEPYIVFPDCDRTRYRVYSLSTASCEKDQFGNPVYKNDTDYLIRSEEYGIPQCRHRVILLGIREDLDAEPKILSKSQQQQTLKEIIGDLPALRSGISKEYLNATTVVVDGKPKKKRAYRQIKDSDETWIEAYQNHKSQLARWNEFSDETCKNKPAKSLQIGSEFVKCASSIDKTNPLYTWYIDEKLGGVPNHETRTHLLQDLKRYLFAAMYTKEFGTFPRMSDYERHSKELLPDHESAASGKFADRFRVQVPDRPATTVTSHIAKDGHYFIHYDETQCRSLTVREAARIQTFPDNYVFCGSRTAQYHQVGNAVPPYLAYQIGVIVMKFLKSDYLALP